MKSIKAPPFLGTTWINSPTLTIEELKGKPVLIHFWTYSDINCRKVIPALRKLWGHYNKKIKIISIHTPKFEFEKIEENVETAVNKLGITWPVALDNEMQTWHAYHNHYWPRYYLICPEGNVVWDHIGDGGEYEMETAIRQYVEGERVFKNRRAREYGALTPETYCGRRRNAGLGGNKNCEEGICEYALSEIRSPGVIYPLGTWEQKEESLECKEDESSLLMKYTACQANIVVKGEGLLEVQLDGKPVPYDLRGELIEKKGKTYLELGKPDCYTLVNGHDSERHELKVAAKNGMQIYQFSFS